MPLGMASHFVQKYWVPGHLHWETAESYLNFSLGNNSRKHIFLRKSNTFYIQKHGLCVRVSKVPAYKSSHVHPKFKSLAKQGHLSKRKKGHLS